MQDFDFDAIDRLEQNALAARQTTAHFNQQFAPPQQSFQSYQPPNNNPSISGYCQPPQQQNWNGGGQPAPWQQQQQPWQPPVAAHSGQQQQQPYQGYNAVHPPGQIAYNAPHQQPPQQQQHYSWQQQQPPPQQQWNPQPPPPAPQGYGYPPPHAPQQQQQQGNAWQPSGQRPSTWQPNHLPPIAQANNTSTGFNNYPPPQQQQQQQQQQPCRGHTDNNAGGAGQRYSGATDQRSNRQGQQQHQQGAKAGSGAPTDRAQRDLFSLWGVQKQQQKQQQQQNTVGYNARPSNMPPPLPLITVSNARHQAVQAAKPAAAAAAPYGNTTSIHRTSAAPTSVAPLPLPIRPTGAATGQLMECETTTGILKVNPEAAQHWIYPLGVPEREYQLSAISTALLQNTLVCLPTGLGKTLIAAVVMHNFSRWFPESKVVFVAPTKPLVSQQIEACRRFMGLSPEATAELTGRIKAEERKALWQDAERRIFFCTPQTFFNDVKLGVCPYDAVSCVVVDECHRCTGQSEIAQTLRLMRQKYKLKFRVLGLSATPGSSADQVQEVLTNLGATAVHFRNEEDPDVSPYVHKKNTELVIVEPESEQSNPRTLLLAVLQRLVGHLAGARIYLGPGTAERVTRSHLVNAQNAAKEAAAAGSGGVPSVQAQEWFRQATVLTDLRDSLDKYGILPTAALVRTKLNEERCIKTLQTKEPAFAQFVTRLESAAAAGGGGPRLAQLVGILRQHFEGDGDPGGVIVFASLREGVQSIVDALKQHEPLIRARSFVGQGGGSSGGASGWGSKSTGRSKGGGSSGPGMNQKEQKDAIKGFSNGQYNVLVATCIGEEGLDIPAVDLIICYDATASPTRAVQRRGRTGRFREGRVVYLLGSGREEEHYHRIKEATTQLHSQLRQAERFFDFVLPGPRMLPRQYNPEKIEIDSGFSNNVAAAMEIEMASAAGGAGRGRGRGRGGSTRGGRSGRGTRDPAAPPAGPAGAGVLAMLEAGAIRLAEQGPRYPHAPTSPLPTSQPSGTQFDSPAGPHSLLFPETSSAFIRSGSNGRRLAIAPPPPLEVLLAAATIATAAGADGAENGGGDEQVKVPTPQQQRRMRFLPELGDDGIITLPCGRILQQEEREGGEEHQQQQPAWAFIATAIARPLQPQLDAAAVTAVNGAGASKKRKPNRGRKAVPPPTAMHKPTPPAAVLNLANVAEDVVGHEVQAVQPRAAAAAAAAAIPVDHTIEHMDIEEEQVAAEKEPEVINLVSSEEEQPVGGGGDAGGDGDRGNAVDDANQEDDYLLDNDDDEDDHDDFIESSSQLRENNHRHHAPPPAPATTAAATTAKNIVAPPKQQVEAEEEEHIPLAKRMRMLREGIGALVLRKPLPLQYQFQ
jgi:ERCC4-related helicase